jgi:hypothetical protein
MFHADNVKEAVLSFYETVAVPDLRCTMTCTQELDAYIQSVDDALHDQKTALKDEILKLDNSINELLSKLSNCRSQPTSVQ